MKTRSDMARRSEIDLAILAAILPFLMTPTKSIGSCKRAFRKALLARGFFWFEWLTKCAHCSLLRSLALDPLGAALGDDRSLRAAVVHCAVFARLKNSIYDLRRTGPTSLRFNGRCLTMRCVS